jgi:hypothetical protein
MALRVARGLFRLWLVLSALWIGGVGFVTGQTFPVMPEWAIECERPFDPDAYLAGKPQPEAPCPWLARVKARLVMDEEQRATIQSAILLALVPPAFMLALGSALVWAIKGFRQP